MITATVFLLIFVLISLTLNGLVIATIIHARFYKSRQHIFVLATASFDFLRSSCILSKCVMFFSPPTNNAQTACDVMECFHTWTSVGCSLSIFSVTYDRLAYIVGPVTYKDRMSIKIAAILVGYVVVHSLFCAILPFLGWGKISAIRIYNEVNLICTISWSDEHGYGYFMLIFGYVIPLLVIGIVTIKLSSAVRMRIQFIKIYSSPDAHMWPVGMRGAIQCGRLTELDSSYVKIWRAMSMVLLACISSWLIYIGSGILLIVHHSPDGASLFNAATWMIMLSMTTHIVNALVFGVYNKRYRLAMKSLFLCGKESRSDIRNISSLHDRSPSLEGINDFALNGQNDTRLPNILRPPVGIPRTVWVDKTSISYAWC